MVLQDFYTEFGGEKMDEILDKELLNDEQILWKGQPERSVIFTSGDVFYIPFSIFWCGFAIFWENGVMIARAPFFFKLWGIPFVLVGLYMVFGRFIYKSLKKKYTYYVITNQRVIVLTNLFHKVLQAEFIDRIPCINKSVRSSGVGTIKFGSSSFLGGMYENSGMEFFGSRYSKQVPTFYDIKEVEKVNHLVNELSRK